MVVSLAASCLSNSIEALTYAVYNGTSPSYIVDTTTRISTLSYLASGSNSESELSLWQVHENGMLCLPILETPLKYLYSSEPSKHTF